MNAAVQPPLAGAEIWTAVMAAATSAKERMPRCQCRGVCGTAHSKSAGWCPRKHGDRQQTTDRFKEGTVKLIAAPIDLKLSPQAAAALPASDLTAWCPSCHDGARRIATKARAEESAARLAALTPSLFAEEAS